VKVDVAAVSPLKKPTDEENIPRAIQYLDEAVRQGAKIICFPENYLYSDISRVPKSDIESYPGVLQLLNKARESGVYVIPGTMAERTNYGNKFYNTALLLGPNGAVIGKYRKTHLAVEESEKQRIPGGKEEVLKVFKTEYGNMGIHICYEICFPEVARITALAGAEMMFWPSGGKYYEIRETWRHLIWARAIENLAYVVSCSNIFGMERGITIIAGPEEVLAERDNEGVVTATLDIDRIHWLRKTPESFDIPKPFKCVPGTLMDWEPDLYHALIQ